MSFPVVFLLLILVDTCQSQKLSTQPDCMRLFSANKSRFNVCLTHECIIFRDEVPFVFMDPNMTRLEHEEPFPCIRHKESYSKLKGAFFDIVKEIPTLSDAYCIWSGPDCSFDGEIDFLNETATGTSSDDNKTSYQFMVGGLLFVRSNRWTTRTIPSESLLEDTLHVLGPPKGKSTTTGEAWQMIWKPFTFSAWIVIFASIIGHGLVRLWMCLHFTWWSIDGFSWRQFRARLFGLYYPNTPLQDGNDENWEHMDSLWSLIAKLFTAILLVLWEVAIAVNVFEKSNLPQLTSFEPEQFAITANTTMHRLFSDLMIQKGIEGNLSSKFHNLQEVYTALEDQSNTFQYTLSYEIMNRYKMNQDPSICNNLVLYPKFPDKYLDVLPQNPPRYKGVWFMSSNLNGTRRNQINNEIFNLKNSRGIDEIVNRWAGKSISAKCNAKQNSTSIDWTLISLLLLVLPGFPFFVFVCCMIICSIRTCRVQHKEEKLFYTASCMNARYSQDRMTISYRRHKYF